MTRPPIAYLTNLLRNDYGVRYNCCVMTPLPEIFERDKDGEIAFKGHRLRLIDVAARYEEGHAPEAILIDFYPTLSLALIYRAIAYHLENRDEVCALIAANKQAMKDLESKLPPAPDLSELRRRMEVKRRAEAS